MTMYGLTPAQCLKVKEVGDLMSGEQRAIVIRNMTERKTKERKKNAPKCRCCTKHWWFFLGNESRLEESVIKSSVLTNRLWELNENSAKSGLMNRSVRPRTGPIHLLIVEAQLEDSIDPRPVCRPGPPPLSVKARKNYAFRLATDQTGGCSLFACNAGSSPLVRSNSTSPTGVTYAFVSLSVVSTGCFRAARLTPILFREKVPSFNIMIGSTRPDHE
nr:50S ribosomal protein L14, chloroplast [Tanacetum cinerariifolium]